MRSWPSAGISSATPSWDTRNTAPARSLWRRWKKKMENLTLNYLQRAINKIDGITVGDSKPSDKYFMKFIEEVGELSESIRKDKRMSNDEIKGTIEEELYDVLYYIIRLANVYNIDLEKSIYLKEQINAKKYNRKSICDKNFFN